METAEYPHCLFMVQVLKRKARTIYQKEQWLWREKSMAPPQGQPACPSLQCHHPQQHLKGNQEQSGLSDMAIFNKQDLQGQSPSFYLFSGMRTSSLPILLNLQGAQMLECTSNRLHDAPGSKHCTNLWGRIKNVYCHHQVTCSLKYRLSSWKHGVT